MKILICGMDGYIGWPLALHQLELGNEVFGIDNFSRRKNVDEVGSWSITPILSMEKRLTILQEKYSSNVNFLKGDMLNEAFIGDVLKKFVPDVVVHLAEQASAPFSMINQEHTIYTQTNNVIGSLNLLYSIKNHAPKSHLVKLGTMGEYGYGYGLNISEGFCDAKINGKNVSIPFPKQAGSWYHWTKVHDSNNIMFACKLWGLKSTDIMQGIVYGTRTEEINSDSLLTRFDIDEAFGTVINRFCAQAAINHKLTIYGKGGQKRGFLTLSDSIQCISLLIENPPANGEYRVVNQFDQIYQISDLANRVKKIGDKKDLNVIIDHIENPRVELEEHEYKAEHNKLKELGFKPTKEIDDELESMLDDLIKFKQRIIDKQDSFIKKFKWN